MTLFHWEIVIAKPAWLTHSRRGWKGNRTRIVPGADIKKAVEAITSANLAARDEKSGQNGPLPPIFPFRW
jgi:hypothetical protein